MPYGILLYIKKRICEVLWTKKKNEFSGKDGFLIKY
jgi:hypothetical protein